MAEGNSFTNLLKLMQAQGYNKDVRITIGSVKSPKPLTIDINGIEIEEEDFVMSQTIQLIVDGSLSGAEPMKAKDKVLVIIDENNFYIIDRVVG